MMKRRGSNSSTESVGESREQSPAPSPLASPLTRSPLASPLTSRRNKEPDTAGPGEGSAVRAKLNLLEERLRGEMGGSRVIKSQQKEEGGGQEEPTLCPKGPQDKHVR